jgi:hypothetical protein
VGVGAGVGAGAGAGAGIGAGANADASARTLGGIDAADDEDASVRTGAGTGEGTGAGASSVGVESRIGWVDSGLDVSEVMVVELDDDVDKVGQDIPEEEVVTVGEVNWAGADGTNTVTRRTECCGDGGSAERGQTADTALLRDTVDRSCRRDEVELEVKYEELALVRGIEVGLEEAERGVLAVSNVDREAADGMVAVLKVDLLGLLVECCSGDGGGERGQSADSDGTLLE